MAIIKSVLLGSMAALAGMGFASAASCSGPVINSISYCNPVEKIVYKGLGFAGSYQEVTGMDLNSCTCSYTSKPFSGPLAPLDEGLSIHFRGPMHLKRMAVYTPGAYSKRDVHAHQKRHGHHAHNNLKRALTVITTTQTIVVDPSGNTLWPLPTNVGKDNKEKEKGKFEEYEDVKGPKTTPAPGSGSGDGKGGNSGKGDGGDKEDDKPVPAGKWGRRAYYDAAAQTASGLVFMNHAGGQGSGVFDQNCAGLSISYMSPDTKKGSATPQILHNAQINTRDEFLVFSDEKCDSSCGFYRPGIPAYKGFGGKQKVFLFEFTMPEHKTPGNDFNEDLPAIWFLNSKIPRTAQYGLKDKPCSCWGSGCGELDIFEVLKDANSYVKTHYHSKQGARGEYGGGGDPNFFPRPYSKPIIGCVVFDEPSSSVFITTLPAGKPFPESFDESFLEELKGQKTGSASIFNLST